jgi:hypothetical protein
LVAPVSVPLHPLRWSVNPGRHRRRKVTERNRRGRISAAELEHSEVMQSIFSQIIIGIIVTVVGTVIADRIVGGGPHIAPAIHLSSNP